MYDSIKFHSYRKKDWSNDGTVCLKGSLVEFDSNQAGFKISITGKNQIDFVNSRSNLLFTSEFTNNSTSFIKTNRLVTCSAFKSQNEVSSPVYLPLWEKLEQSFGSNITLFDYPEIQLVPAFERGEIVQTTNKIRFKGLVSNASSSGIPITPFE